MSIVFPRQRLTRHNVLGRWRPQTFTGRVQYWSWYGIGVPLVALLYPLALFGFAIRYYARKLDNTATRIGIVGVVLISIAAWGILSIVALVQFPLEGFLAVVAAAIVATVSAALAVVFTRVGGRKTTVLLAYPFAMTAIFLPPVVASLYSPTVAQHVLPPSERLAIWILDNILHVFGINAFLRSQFTLEGAAFAAMWFGIAVPMGWFLGTVVSLADTVRPKESDGGEFDRPESSLGD